MNALDFSPLFRSTVGFDRLSQMLESSLTADQGVSYPPYNILKLDDDHYRITMAVAGFAEKDIDITAKENQLIVQGKALEREETKDATYLHRGIAERAFERRFQLAEHIRVSDASLNNGLLTVELVREIPEAMKPRKVEIKAGGNGKTLDHKEGKKGSCGSC
ncbi:MAG: Hsp20 family protein [Alphaproteobacteria bacterium]|nr:MAG: Hsp20 family protein [Alphaproteobacteria bacterium]